MDTRQFISTVDGLPIRFYEWATPSPKAIVVISHGAAEHGGRVAAQRPQREFAVVERPLPVEHLQVLAQELTDGVPPRIAGCPGLAEAPKPDGECGSEQHGQERQKPMEAARDDRRKQPVHRVHPEGVGRGARQIPTQRRDHHDVPDGGDPYQQMAASEPADRQPREQAQGNGQQCRAQRDGSAWFDESSHRADDGAPPHRQYEAPPATVDLGLHVGDSLRKARLGAHPLPLSGIGRQRPPRSPAYAGCTSPTFDGKPADLFR